MTADYRVLTISYETGNVEQTVMISHQRGKPTLVELTELIVVLAKLATSSALTFDELTARLLQEHVAAEEAATTTIAAVEPPTPGGAP